MCRGYPSTGFHSQADAEHRANATARAAWADPDALIRRPATGLDEWSEYMQILSRIRFSAGGIPR